MIKDSTVNAFVLLRCSQTRHTNCTKMRNLVVEKMKNVTQAYTTSTVVDGEKYCVAARAIVNKKDIPRFKSKLNKLSHPSTDLSVEKLKVLLTA